MREDQLRAIFLLANIGIKQIYKIENEYWPEAYVEERKNSPWWLVNSELGLIKIGWRKRVISINWEACEVRGIVTSQDVTKDDTMVHAWSYGEAVSYLSALRALEQIRVAQD